MKTRSKVLFEYLQQSGVLHGTPEAIALAKKQYRTLYKKQWKQTRRPRKELRIDVTVKQYQLIKNRAVQYGQTPTAYARNAILSIVTDTPVIARRDMLLRVLQAVGMALTGMQKGRAPCQLALLLEQAEQLLLTYLNT